MRQILNLISILTIGLFLVVCSKESSSVGFSKSGKVGDLEVIYSSEKPLVVGDNSPKYI